MGKIVCDATNWDRPLVLSTPKAQLDQRSVASRPSIKFDLERHLGCASTGMLARSKTFSQLTKFKEIRTLTVFRYESINRALRPSPLRKVNPFMSIHPCHDSIPVFAGMELIETKIVQVFTRSDHQIRITHNLLSDVLNAVQRVNVIWPNGRIRSELFPDSILRHPLDVSAESLIFGNSFKVSDLTPTHQAVQRVECIQLIDALIQICGRDYGRWKALSESPLCV